MAFAFIPAAVGQSAFPQGIASGDVTDNTAVLWTRTTQDGEIEAQIGLDDRFSSIIQVARIPASPAADFTIKFDAATLRPATTYFFRFSRLDSGERSAVGRFTTAPPPEAATAFRFVYSGDSNAADRPFHLLKFAADEAPDFWLWAGDTIYADGVADDLPPATDLGGYRAKHKQNREDPFLRDLLARAPVWTQWDDHEVANDYDGGDIEPDIGAERMIAGQTAFLDYMPIRPQGAMDDPRRIYRSFRYGSLAEFFILDCRQYRSADLSRDGGGPDPHAYFLPLPQFDILAKLQDPSRSMLGGAQLDWLKSGLKSSTARWKFILSSVSFTSLLIIPYDRWDGYEAERYDLLRFIDTEGISGVVLLSADIHGNIHNPDVTRFQRDHLGAVYSPGFAVPEFVVGPIATDTFRQEVRDIGALLFGQSQAQFDGDFFFNLSFGLVALRVIQDNQLRFVEADRYAYLAVDVGPENVTLSYKGIVSDPSVENPSLQTMHTATLPEASQDCGPGFLLPAGLCGSLGGCGLMRRRIRRGRLQAA